MKTALVLNVIDPGIGGLLIMGERARPRKQAFILSDATAKVLVLEQAFAGIVPALQNQLPDTHVVGLDFAPPHAGSFGGAAGGGARRSQQPAC